MKKILTLFSGFLLLQGANQKIQAQCPVPVLGQYTLIASTCTTQVKLQVPVFNPNSTPSSVRIVVKNGTKKVDTCFIVLPGSGVLTTKCFSSNAQDTIVITGWHDNNCTNTSCSPLGLHFTNVGIKKKTGNVAEVFWNVAVDNMGTTGTKFSIERSVTGVDFQLIGYVFLQPGWEYYSFPDVPPGTGNFFYRILFTEGNNKQYSPVRFVSFEKPKDVESFVNGQNLFFKGLPENQPMITTIYDLSGKLLIKKQHLSTEGISVGNLTNGIYIVSIYSDRNIYKSKFFR